MYNRTEFLRSVSGVTAGIAFTGCGLVGSALGSPQAGGAGNRRKVMVSGRSDACLTAFPENCKPLKKLPSVYLKQLYYDSLIGSTEGLRHLVATVGASQVVLETDFPTMWNDHDVNHVPSTPGLSDTDKRAIRGGNAAKLLRIDIQPDKHS